MKHISSIFLKKGFLIQPDLINFLGNFDPNFVLELLLFFKAPKIISLDFFKKNKSKIIKVLDSFLIEDKFDKNKILNFKLKMENISSKEENMTKPNNINDKEGYELVYDINKLLKPKKVGVRDFVNFFRNRFNYFKEILKERKELTNLISLDRLPKTNQNLSIIGIILEKRETKNKNIFLVLEDGKGLANVLINKNKPELYEKAENLVEDEVIGIKGFGNNEIIFASNIIFPEIINENHKKSKYDDNFLFISDLHIGHKNFFEENFKKFIKWVNCELGNGIQKAKAKKISHIFITGDLVDGVGIYPGQEDELSIKDIKDQYKYAAELFDEIRKDIKLVFIPGNHDAVRSVVPQIFNDYALPLQSLENAELLPNPSYYLARGYRILLYHGHGFDFFADNVYGLKKLKPKENPEMILKFLLVKRHLAPTHGSTLYMPAEEDFFIIKKVPDIFVTSHVHKTGTTNFRNILLISTSCWQPRTPYQEKFGHIPDPCKVPIFNTKTRKLNILDFS